MEITNYSEQVSTEWIEALALEELNMEMSGVVNMNEHLSPAGALEESSIRFMDELKDHFELFVSKFNEYRGASAQIKLFKISNTVNDFMLYRNSLRLILNRRANDTIAIGFLTGSGEMLPARLGGNTPSVNGPHEIKAHVGAFNEITWRFRGEIVNVEAVARFYMSEFIRNSAH